MNNPWMKFYPADWRADPALRLCSLAARGLWMEMLCIMHEAEPRGNLVVNGRAVEPKMLAGLVGADVLEVECLLCELRDAGVFSVRRNGVIFSRRIDKDEIKSRKNKENGRMGGNPTLCKQTEKTGSVNPPLKPRDARDLEARSQKEREGVETCNKVAPSTQTKETDNGQTAELEAGGSAETAEVVHLDNKRKYSFEAGIIRVAQRDLDRWRAAYSHLGSLEAELLSLQKWAGEQGDNWFFAIQGALAKRDREALLAVERVRAEAAVKANTPKVQPRYYCP